MLSPIGSSSGYQSGLTVGAPSDVTSGAVNTGGNTPDSAPAAAAVVDDGATTESPAASTPAVQISLSAEAELTLTTYQETKISISQTSGDSSSGGSSKTASAPQDPESAKALSTLEAIVQNEREWIAKLKAEAEGKDPSTVQSSDNASEASKSSANTSNSANTGQTSGVQVSIEQDTEVDLSLSVSAQVDIQA